MRASDDDSDDSLILSFQFLQDIKKRSVKNGNYKSTDILIDTGSTLSVFNNNRMLLNVRRSKKTMRAYSNGGHQDSNLVGDFPAMFEVWYNPESMLNIMSFKDVRKHFRITIDTDVENTVNVHLKCGKVLKFEEVESGLYLLRSNNESNKKVSAYSYLTLVKANKSQFTTREVKRADAARSFRKYLGYPGYKRFFRLLEVNHFRNCPLTVDDAKRALHIYGPGIESIKGKRVRKRPQKIEDRVMIYIPDTIKELHPYVQLSVGYFFVQGVAFLHSISRGYTYRTVEHHNSYNKKYKNADMSKGIKKCINMYHKIGLTVTQLNADNEFGCIEYNILPTRLNV